MTKFYLVADLDVDKFVYEQKHVSCNPNADRIKFKNSIADKKAKNPLEKHTKRSLSLRNEGKKTMKILLKEYIYCKPKW